MVFCRTNPLQDPGISIEFGWIHQKKCRDNPRQGKNSAVAIPAALAHRFFNLGRPRFKGNPLFISEAEIYRHMDEHGQYEGLSYLVSWIL